MDWMGAVMVMITNVTMQLVPITTKVASSNPAHGKVYSIQHYVVQYSSLLHQ